MKFSLYQPEAVNALAVLNMDSYISASWLINPDNELEISLSLGDDFILENSDFSILKLDANNQHIFINILEMVYSNFINKGISSTVLNRLTFLLTLKSIESNPVTIEELGYLDLEEEYDFIHSLFVSIRPSIFVNTNSLGLLTKQDSLLMVRSLLATAPHIEDDTNKLFVKHDKGELKLNIDCSNLTNNKQDTEEVNHENIHILEKLSVSIKELSPSYVQPYLGSMFASQIRKTGVSDSLERTLQVEEDYGKLLFLYY
jgi:hypothetical protein